MNCLNQHPKSACCGLLASTLGLTTAVGIGRFRLAQMFVGLLLSSWVFELSVGSCALAVMVWVWASGLVKFELRVQTFRVWG